MADADPMEIDRLLSRAKAGDRAASASLLKHYRRYLKLLARVYIDRHLKSKADPSDLVQDACLLAIRDFGDFRGGTEAELVNWLRTILANCGAKLVRHYLGTQGRDVRLERQMNETVDASSRAISRMFEARDSSPSVRASRRESSVLLADALSQLPSNYREALILHHLEGHTIAETAQQMGKSTDSVKKLLARGTIRLRALLKESQ